MGKKFLRTALFSVILTVSFQIKGDSSTQDFILDINNPFHDVFYLYNSDRKASERLLTKLIQNDKFRTQALINYGIILEREKKISAAEENYLQAYGNKEKVAMIYLYNLSRKNNRGKTISLILDDNRYSENKWVLYEKAVICMEKNENDKAVEYLSSAVKKGFTSTELLQNDPVFSPIKTSNKFTELIEEAKSNYKASESIIKKMKDAEYSQNADKPYGLRSEFDAASYYEKTGKITKAKDILTSMINKKISLRDRSIALYWLARLSSKLEDKVSAKKYLLEFTNSIRSSEKDSTGFKELIVPVYNDIIYNDRYLKDLAVK